MKSQSKHQVIVFSAPSGSGKSTVVNHLLKVIPNLAFSVSATTRKPRGKEEHGKDYYYFSPESFEEQVKKGAFLEYEEVYKGLFYGTLHSEVERIWALNQTVIFDVDVKGGLHIKKTYGDRALCVFLKPPSLEVLEQRLKLRSTEVEHELAMRLNKAKEELAFEDQYDLVIVNDKLEETLQVCEAHVRNFLGLSAE